MPLKKLQDTRTTVALRAKSVVLESNEPILIVNPSFLKKVIPEIKHIREGQSLITRMRDVMIKELLYSGYNLILDDLNLDPKIEHDVRYKFSTLADIKVRDFTNVPLETCIDRNSARKEKISTDTLIDRRLTNHP